MKEWKQTIVRFYVIATLVLMPIYYDNGYFNTLMAKARIFWMAAGVALSFAAALWAVNVIMTGKIFPTSWENVKKNFNLMDAAVLGFGLVATLSCIFSSYRAAAFAGSSGWNIGAGTIILLTLMYFYVSRYYKEDKWLWVYMAVALTIEYSLALLNGIAVDPLGLHTKLTDDELFEYIATVGNINSYAGYLSLTIPVICMAFIMTQKGKLKIWYGLLAILGFTNLFMGNSDGAFLGAGFALLFLVYYCLKQEEKYIGLLHVGMFFAVAAGIVKLLQLFWPGQIVEFAGISEFILDSWIFIPMGVICLICCLIKRFATENFLKGLQKVLPIIWAILAIGAVVALVTYTAMHFSGKWGTKRGWIWGFAVTVFAEGSIKDKLIGVGPDCFGIPVMSRFSDFISEHWGKRIANAHNEYLQYLVTTGALGALSYVMMYISSWREYVKRIQWNDIKAALFFGVMGYAGQAVVNNPQAMNMATLFLFLAIYRSYAIMGKEEVAEVNTGKVNSNKKNSGKKGKKRK